MQNMKLQTTTKTPFLLRFAAPLENEISRVITFHGQDDIEGQPDHRLEGSVLRDTRFTRVRHETTDDDESMFPDYSHCS